jgi:hypothetical protein
MKHAAKRIESPGIEPVPLPDEATIIGGRAETWTLPQPRTDDELFEPNIVRGLD